MKLTELNPRWISDGLAHVPRHGMGISFDCPVHRDHRLAIWFANPVDNGPAVVEAKYKWLRQGAEFDSMTLSPSIDATVQYPGCWHGHIQTGTII
jgi:hypothetical protein